MSISFVTGKPGGGKGLLAMKNIVDELMLTSRPIITNLAVRVEPWVNGKRQPQLGLREYLLREHGTDFNVRSRMFSLPDEHCAEFYLWRPAGENGCRSLRRAKVTESAPLKDSKPGEVKIIEFDPHLLYESGPCLIVIDEAWKFWRARSWQKTGEGLEFYNAQHRKLGDDVLICCQHTKQIDPAIYRVAQDFWVVRNHAKMTAGVFGQPPIFSVSIFDQPPTGGPTMEPMSRKVFRLDAKGLAQTYDTAAGVGLAGRAGADIGHKRRGLPWWTFLIFGAVIVAGISQAPKLLDWFTRKQIASKPLPLKTAAESVTVTHWRTNEPIKQTAKESYTPVTNQARASVFYTGRVWFPAKGFVYYLSDGRAYTATDKALEHTYPYSIVVNGVEYQYEVTR